MWVVYQAGHSHNTPPARGLCLDPDTPDLRSNFSSWSRNEKGFKELGTFSSKDAALEYIRGTRRGLFRGVGLSPDYDF